MSGKRLACLILVVAVAALGCANGRPAPVACALIGQVAAGGAGVAAGNKTGSKIGYGVGGAVLGSVAGYYLCKLFEEKEAPAPPPPPPPPPPKPAPVVEEPAPVVPPPVKERIVLRGVNFDFDKAEIRPDAAIVLDEAISILAKRADVAVRVEGHTDATGPEVYNQGLSERRASSVLQYLAEHGIAASRLSSAGFGESQPIATNDTREGRALNRRVELQVLE
jgi:outer membrane protein OmpA-like peptidoglycan-associated protein